MITCWNVFWYFIFQIPIVVLGNMIDLPDKKVDSEFARNWSTKEKGLRSFHIIYILNFFSKTDQFSRCWNFKFLKIEFNCVNFSVKLYEVTAKNRNTLVDVVVYLGSRHFHSQRKLFVVKRIFISEHSAPYPFNYPTSLILDAIRHIFVSELILIFKTDFM